MIAVLRQLLAVILCAALVVPTCAESKAIASYAYTLDAAGHRTSVVEQSGRTVSYGYDNLYRLTSETIASDPNAVNGAATYSYDPVGNRKQKVLALPGFPGGLSIV